ncbi:hypothetical protein [Haloarcula sp. 1CSR25-25]|uniref:hypothetical protein n=1 Tax=Haloarcula sp. 1CSR25-25 TaxID=2862545 RepID=UPI002899A509|nr:hypothetical protein [Haloarcula sp. 1CSR25-25]
MAYIFLYIASSESVSSLRNGDELACRLARGRGLSEVVRSVEDGDEVTEILASERGYVTIESGYMMEFVDESDTHLPAVDVAKMNDRRAYRVPSEAVESLPAHILSELEEQEYVRIRGEYNSDGKEFSDVSLGWHSNDKSPWDLMMEELDRREVVNPVLDYLVFEHGSDRWTPEAIAEARGVQPETVRDNIQNIRTTKEQDSS